MQLEISLSKSEMEAILTHHFGLQDYNVYSELFAPDEVDGKYRFVYDPGWDGENGSVPSIPRRG